MFWRVCALLGGICGEFNQKKGICTIWKRIGTAFSLLQQKWESGVQLQPKNTFRNISFLFRGKMRTESFTLWKSEMLAAQRIFSSTFNQQPTPTPTPTCVRLRPPTSTCVHLRTPASTCIWLGLPWTLVIVLFSIWRDFICWPLNPLTFPILNFVASHFRHFINLRAFCIDLWTLSDLSHVWRHFPTSLAVMAANLA